MTIRLKLPSPLTRRKHSCFPWSVEVYRALVDSKPVKASIVNFHLVKNSSLYNTSRSRHRSSILFVIVTLRHEQFAVLLCYRALLLVLHFYVSLSFCSCSRSYGVVGHLSVFASVCELKFRSAG